MPTIYLVVVTDYEADSIIGAYSSADKATTVADELDVLEYGRFGPYVLEMELDAAPAPAPGLRAGR